MHFPAPWLTRQPHDAELRYAANAKMGNVCPISKPCRSFRRRQNRARTEDPLAFRSFSHRFLLLLLFLLLLIQMLSGCATTRLTRSRFSGIRSLPSSGLMPFSSPSVEEMYTESTRVGLRTLNLDRQARKDPKKTLALLEESLRVTPRLGILAMLSEVAWAEGKRTAGQRFLSQEEHRLVNEWHLRAARYAFLYLFDEQWESSRNPYSPAFQNVCRIFNESSEAVLRYSGDEENEVFTENGSSIVLDLPDSMRTIPLKMHSREWVLEDFSSFRFASDFELTGLKNRYRRYGLGVPLIARVNDIHQKSERYRYCLQEMCVPMTAFLTFDEQNVPRFEFIDTMESASVRVGKRYIPLEIDYTTPLAYSFEKTIEKNALDGATLGLLDPDSLLKETEDGSRTLKGIYMPQAYDPNKIPVVMVHGIWSSARTWLETYNTLNNFPKLRDKYQFWFYFYPNGQPFWVSAAEMSDDLAALRRELDPQRTHANMDQMILLGHSMGGLVSVLQTIDSEERFWNLITAVPPHELPGNADSNAAVARWFHSKPNPSIRCVITMGTPFRGSGFANSTTRNLTEMIGRTASHVEKNLKQFRKENRAHIQNDELLNYVTALDSLQKNSIFWDALLTCSPSPDVTYVNIIARLRSEESGSQSDGVVSVESATLPWAQETIFVRSLHREIPNSAEAILAVAKVLLKRLEPNGTQSAPENLTP